METPRPGNRQPPTPARSGFGRLTAAAQSRYLPVYGVFVSLEGVVDRGAHAGRHAVGVRRVRVLVRVQLRPVVEVHRLHGAGAVRVPVHGGRYAHPVHPVVGQVFVLRANIQREGEREREKRL